MITTLPYPHPQHSGGRLVVTDTELDKLPSDVVETADAILLVTVDGIRAVKDRWDKLSLATNKQLRDERLKDERPVCACCGGERYIQKGESLCERCLAFRLGLAALAVPATAPNDPKRRAIEAVNLGDALLGEIHRRPYSRG